MLLLGLDPGSTHTGYGLVERQGDRLTVVAHGRLSPRRGVAVAERLGQLSRELEELLAELCPEVVALEALFHGVNTRSLIVLAQARGALLATLARHGVEIVEYSPAQVKSAVTGNGRAEKGQVERMVRLLLDLDAERLSSDASDALAVALCALQRHRLDRLGRDLEGVK